MGKTLSLVIGSFVLGFGILLLVLWFSEFLILVKAILPVFLIIGGVIAIASGIAEMKDTAKLARDESEK